MPAVDFVANLLVPVWFILWLICMVKIVQVSRYERRFNIYEGMTPLHFSISEVFRRIKHYRSIDPAYDRIRRSVSRWMIITVCFWVLSFGGFLMFAFWTALSSP
jgi:hypothetical protein